MIFLSENIITRREELSIPIEDFITSLFNLNKRQINSIVIKRNEDDLIDAYIVTVPSETECPCCGAKLVANGHGRPKIITHSLLVQNRCHLHWTPQRFICTNPDCHKSVTEKNPFTFPGFQISYVTVRQIMLDLKKPNMSFKDVAEKNDVSITQVQRYFDSYVHAVRPNHLPVNLGIDEIHSDMAKYGSNYLCILVDNEKRQIFDILPSRSKHELIKYFEQYPAAEREKVRYVTIDMWEAYKDVSGRLFKNCEVAVDPFHVVKHLLDAFSSLRISIMNQVDYGSSSYYLLKKWNWLMTSNDVELDNKRIMNRVFNRYMNRRDLLEATLAINDDLSAAYNLMKMYQSFNEICPPEEAESQLNEIIENFSSLKYLYIEILYLSYIIGKLR